MTRPFRRQDTGDARVDEVQRRVEEFATPLTRSPLLDGLLAEDVSVGTAETEVGHGLGRRPRGYLVVGADTHATLRSTRSATSRLLYLEASAAGRFSLFVF